MVCECWKDRKSGPETVKVNTRRENQTIAIQEKEIIFIRLKVLQNGQFEIADVRKNKNADSSSWQTTVGRNYYGQIEDIEFSHEDHDYVWVKSKPSVNPVLSS